MGKYLEFETPAQKQATEYKSEYGLKNHGLVHLDRVFWNLPEAALYEEAIFRGEGKLVTGGAFLVHTGKWTARAANDKYFVSESSTDDKIDWGKNNRPICQEKFNGILHRCKELHCPSHQHQFATRNQFLGLHCPSHLFTTKLTLSACSPCLLSCAPIDLALPLPAS